jgi:hypothetical protein
MLKCFDLHDQAECGMVVFASGHQAALLLGSLHLIIHHGRLAPKLTAIERELPFSGAARDYLIAAIAADVPGIGHLQPDGRWVVHPPDAEPKISVAPRPTEMHPYVDEDDIHVVLFTYDRDRANNVHRTIMDGKLSLPERWVGSAWQIWQQDGLVRHQGQAEACGIEGIGVYTLDGWKILPLNYAALGVDLSDIGGFDGGS